MRIRWSSGVLLALTAGLASAPAQRPLQFDVVYSCSNGQTKLKVVSCAGNSDGDPCDIQYLDNTPAQRPGARISAPRKQVTDLLQTCVIQRPPAKTENAAPPAAAAPPRQQSQRPPAPSPSQPPAPAASQPRPTAPPPTQQVGVGGFKIGDTVSASTGFGWVDGKILAIRGNSYYVHLGPSLDVWKDYPRELRRIGGNTAEDHAMGIYELHDRVQVLFEGKWVDSEVVSSLNNEYQVTIPGNRVAWANPQQLRYVGPQIKPTAPKPGTPPKPGLVSCAGKIEGRYSAGGFGNFNITFRYGKATMSMYGDDKTLECWTGGGKIYLRSLEPGEKDMVLDVNNDGSIDTPLGEIRKKGA